MKKTLTLCIVFGVLIHFSYAQSLSITSSELTEVTVGTSVTIDFRYSTAAVGNVYASISLYNGAEWVQTIADTYQNTTVGTDIDRSFTINIPAETTLTSFLTDNQNYKLSMVLSDNSGNWLVGAYPANEINMVSDNPTNILPEISFITAPLTKLHLGQTISVGYGYSIPENGKVYCAINLYQGNVWVSTVSNWLSTASKGNDITNTMTFYIPKETVPSEKLATGQSYKIAMELTDESGTKLAGVYPTETIEISANLDLRIGEGFQLLGESDYFGNGQEGIVFQMHDNEQTNGTTDGGFVFRGHTPKDSKSQEWMVIKSGGDIGIGTTAPDAKLAVAGKIHCQEVKVDVEEWSDFVFEEHYDLPSLQEVAQHIAAKRHLQGIPTTAEVLENGIELGTINAKLLQKIEELTLYALEQQKKLQEQENRLAVLEKDFRSKEVITIP